MFKNVQVISCRCLCLKLLFKTTDSFRLDDKLTVKVSDFGLTRDVYSKDYYRVEDKTRGLPIRWMSLESIQQSVFSIQSDVVSACSKFY